MLVKLIDGTKFVDIFDDQSSRHVIFKERGRIARDQIKKMTPYIDPGWNWVKTNSPQDFDAAQAKEFPNLCPLRRWINTGETYSERNGFMTGYSGGYWEVCQKVLSADGKCPEHGQVRYSPHHKFDEPKEEPSLRKTPPKRRAGGRTRPRRMYGNYHA